MSVLKNNRDESNMQFLDNMKLLHYFTINYCIEMPKRWDRFLTEDICKLATRALVGVKLANSTYPTNQDERQIRKNAFNDAYGSLEAMVTLVDNLYDYCENSGNTDFKLNLNKVEKWIDAISIEMKLIKGVMKKDNERFKKLPDKMSNTAVVKNESKK